MNENKVILLRHIDSPLCDDMEMFLQEINRPYITYYTEDEPTIITLPFALTYKGENGFATFKHINESKNNNHEN